MRLGFSVRWPLLLPPCFSGSVTHHRSDARSINRLAYEQERRPARLTPVPHLDPPAGGDDVGRGLDPLALAEGQRRSWISGSAGPGDGMGAAS